jgi:RimJ/RimL family protein N-acetyltransferase
VDFKNDVLMSENKESFKEYFYDKKNIDLYVDTKKAKGYVLLAITYKDEVIGEIRFKNISNESAELGIVLKNDEYKNKGLGSYSLSKSIDYAKEVLRLKKILVSILPNNTRSIHVFEKIGFKEIKEDNNFIWFEKII